MTLLQDGFNNHLKEIFRDMIFENDVRCDGRGLDELRKISCEVGAMMYGKIKLLNFI